MKRPRFARRKVFLALSLTLAFGLTACSLEAGSNGTNGDGSVPASARAESDSLTTVAIQDLGTLDYTTSNLTALRLWIPNIVEPLVYFDREGNASGAVADDWTISDDLKTYTFHIRDGITFSDGAPVTAEDVVYSLQTMQQSPVADIAAAYTHVTDIRKVDDATVEVQLSQPSRSFWDGMGRYAGMIQPKAAADSIATKPIGTGPYQVDSYVSNGSLNLKANPNYWGEPPDIKDVAVEIIPDPAASLNAMVAGEADLYAPVQSDLWSQVDSRGLDETYNAVTFPQGGEPFYIVINSKLDKPLREAIAKLVDGEKIVSRIKSQWQPTPTCTFAKAHRPWSTPASPETCPHQYDPEAAAAEIEAGGYGEEELTFVQFESDPAAEIVAAELEQAGLDVELESRELALYSQTIFSGNPPQFDITAMSGPDTLSQWTCPEPGQAAWTTYCNEEYNELIARADAAGSVEEYDSLMAEAAALLQRDAVVNTYSTLEGAGLLHPDLEGWTEPKVETEIVLSSLSWRN